MHISQLSAATAGTTSEGDDFISKWLLIAYWLLCMQTILFHRIDDIVWFFVLDFRIFFRLVFLLPCTNNQNVVLNMHEMYMVLHAGKIVAFYCLNRIFRVADGRLSFIHRIKLNQINNFSGQNLRKSKSLIGSAKHFFFLIQNFWIWIKKYSVNHVDNNPKQHQSK